ncbi:hypothetical protein [Hymenobacter metallicola]|uniref:Uncharacterized protein n=1 Tax=Hymenobacter metallicola TaxID=2563114 RepID=A0A4Z0QBQ3_9BACT|nr:hypothetical protein [Hymenobacter metallicola]TGE27518.1 hypothetical protein E5K02_14180 [Hymenobacter metallicola]
MLLRIGGFFQGLAQLAVLAIFIGVVSWIARTMIRRNGGQLVPNPLHPGWGKLHDQYESVHNVLRMKDVDGRIGALRGFQLGFDTDDVVIRNPVGFSSLVRIPYREIWILQAPKKISGDALQ